MLALKPPRIFKPKEVASIFHFMKNSFEIGDAREDGRHKTNGSDARLVVWPRCAALTALSMSQRKCVSSSVLIDHDTVTSSFAGAGQRREHLQLSLYK